LRVQNWSMDPWPVNENIVVVSTDISAHSASVETQRIHLYIAAVCTAVAIIYPWRQGAPISKSQEWCGTSPVQEYNINFDIKISFLRILNNVPAEVIIDYQLNEVTEQSLNIFDSDLDEKTYVKKCIEGNLEDYASTFLSQVKSKTSRDRSSGKCSNLHCSTILNQYGKLWFWCTKWRRVGHWKAHTPMNRWH